MVAFWARGPHAAAAEGVRGAERLWTLLHDIKRRDRLAVLAWCVMPNHYHLAVRTGSVPLWRSIRFVQHAYTRGFNRMRKVLGPLWQARYKARPVLDTGALLRVIAYIHLNPVVGKLVEDPGRYRWSGHGELLRRSPRARWCTRISSARRSAAPGGRRCARTWAW